MNTVIYMRALLQIYYTGDIMMTEMRNPLFRFGCWLPVCSCLLGDTYFTQFFATNEMMTYYLCHPECRLDPLQTYTQNM